MSLYVVDASVVIKWFVPENLTAEALVFRNSAHDLHAPSFLDVEITNIVWKKLQRGEISQQDASDIVNQLATLPIIRHSEASLLAATLQLASAAKRTVYDCLYLALAQHLRGVMMTADEKLVNSLSNTPHAPLVQYLGATP